MRWKSALRPTNIQTKSRKKCWRGWVAWTIDCCNQSLFTAVAVRCLAWVEQISICIIIVSVRRNENTQYHFRPSKPLDRQTCLSCLRLYYVLYTFCNLLFEKKKLFAFTYSYLSNSTEAFHISYGCPEKPVCLHVWYASRSPNETRSSMLLPVARSMCWYSGWVGPHVDVNMMSGWKSSETYDVSPFETRILFNFVIRIHINRNYNTWVNNCIQHYFK